MIERDAERDVWDFAKTLVPHIGEPTTTGAILTLAEIVRLAHEAYGEAADPLLFIEITVH
jgi:hypothetical protein